MNKDKNDCYLSPCQSVFDDGVLQGPDPFLPALHIVRLAERKMIYKYYHSQYSIKYYNLKY